MTWMLRLYPPAWRRRYGDELADLIARQPLSLATLFDLAAGAIDAWLSPQASVAAHDAASGREGTKMRDEILELRCAGYGPDVTAADRWKSAVVTLVGAAVLTMAWLWWDHHVEDSQYVVALSPLLYFVPYLFSTRYTHLKGRSAQTQAIFIGGGLVLLTAFFLAVGWLGSMI